MANATLNMPTKSIKLNKDGTPRKVTVRTAAPKPIRVFKEIYLVARDLVDPSTGEETTAYGVTYEKEEGAILALVSAFEGVEAPSVPELKKAVREAISKLLSEKPDTDLTSLGVLHFIRTLASGKPKIKSSFAL